MRTLSIAALALTTVATGAVAQQRVAMHGPVMGGQMSHPMPQPMMGHPAPPPMMGHHPSPPQGHMRPRPGRWGQQVGGHWWGGMRAPGGWGAYRRPSRGYILPSYWIAPGWGISDWSSYGLSQPSYGYSWSRYYDDAVLIDGRGSVYDTVDGIDWDGGYQNGGYDDGDDSVSGGYDQPQPVYPQGGGYSQGGGYPQPGYGASYGYPDGDDRYHDRRSSGVGGALVGAAVGGVAGNVIAGHGDKLGGTLIGAGLGGAAGYAIDRSSDGHGRRHGPPPPPPPYGGPGYEGQGYGAGYPAPGGAPYHGPHGYAPPTVIQSGGGTTVTTSTSGGYPSGTYVNGYYYPPATVTTVTVASAPVVTTATEVFEDTVTYSRPVHKVWRKRTWHPRPKCYCVKR